LYCYVSPSHTQPGLNNAQSPDNPPGARVY
jgi:hypothetical protein